MRRESFSLTIGLLVGFACTASAGEEEGPSVSPALVVVISGFGSDASVEQVAGRSPRGRGQSGMYQLVGDLTNAGVKAHFFNWNGTAAGKFKSKDAPGSDGIVSFIRARATTEQFERLVVIGHSWGGHTMLEVAAKLESEPKIPIALAIGVDPSSLSRGARQSELSSAIKKLVVYYTRNAFVWGPVKAADRVRNVDLGDPKNGFMSNNRPAYAAKLDLNAHNAAEWDERIHAEIIKEILTGMTDSHPPAAQTK